MKLHRRWEKTGWQAKAPAPPGSKPFGGKVGQALSPATPAIRFLLSQLLMLLALGAAAIVTGNDSGTPAAPREGVQPSAPERLEAPPPPFSEGLFPCSNCHAAMTPNRTRRALTEMHTDIVLKHDETHRWCLDCHDATNRDFLHLASGERVAFTESYLLCGQCHGEKLRDWRAGVHGRRIGNWNGAKEYLLCVHCHNPHQPHFRALAPKPAPKRPVRPAE